MNFDDMIGELFGMLKERMKKKNESGLSGHEMTQARNDAIDADLRKRDTELARQGLVNKGALEKQGLANTGDVETQRLRNSGELAKQELASTLGLEGDKYKANQIFAGEKYKSDAGAALSARAGLDEYIKSQVKIMDIGSKEEYSRAVKNLESLKNRFGVAQPDEPTAGEVKPVGAQRATSEFDTPDAVSPKSDIRKGLDKKGAESMTFKTDLGTADNPQKKRKELIDSFYRMNPGIKRQSLFE